MTLPVSVPMLSSPTGPTSVSVHEELRGRGHQRPQVPPPPLPPPPPSLFSVPGENRWLLRRPADHTIPEPSRRVLPCFLCSCQGDPP
jgi:hypothetical protein